MKNTTKVLAQLALVLFASFATAHAAGTLVVNDENVDGGAPNVLNYFVSDTGPIGLIRFDIDYTALGESWGSELLIAIEHVDSGNVINFGSSGNPTCSGFPVTCDADLGFPDNDGDFTAMGELAIAMIADGSGDWTITLSDSFNDDFADGLLNATFELRPVPLPGAIWLLGSACLAAGMRYRRQGRA